MLPGGNPDMSGLLAQAQQLQEQLVAAKDRLAQTQVSGSAASGLVTATVTGTGELVAVTIRPEACDPSDAETLGDMVVAAVRDANHQAEQVAAEQLGPLAGGLDGLDALGGGDASAELPGTVLPDAAQTEAERADVQGPGEGRRDAVQPGDGRPGGASPAGF